MQFIKAILLSLLFLTVLSATECQPGEYVKQGANTCTPGDITDPPGIFLPNCDPGNRLVQGTTSECIETTPVNSPGLFLPSCPNGTKRTQGTDECIASPIGSIQSLAGSKTLAIESIYDNNSTNIYIGDVIVTDENTTASILLNNNTLIKLGIHTFLKITDYAFDDEIAVSPNPHIANPVPFNFIVEGTIEIIDNYIKKVEEPSLEASAPMSKTMSFSSAKEKTTGLFETRRMTYEEYNIYDAINENEDKAKVIYKNEEKNVLIVKIPSIQNPVEDVLYSKVTASSEGGGIISTILGWIIKANNPPPSCPGTTQSGSSGVRGTAFIHSSGTCSDEPAVYVEEGAIDIAENDIDLPLELEEGEVTRDLMDKETADRDLKNGLDEELYRSEPYILNWHTDNCVMSGEDRARCYYDDNHIWTNVRQSESVFQTDYYEIRFYNRENDLVSQLTQSPSYMDYISVYSPIEESSEGGYIRYSGTYSLSTSIGTAYYISKFDENKILRSLSRRYCQYTSYRKYDQYWDAEGNPILNTTEPYIGTTYHNYEIIYYEDIYADSTKCPTYKEVDAILNFDWSQSRLYQLELTGS